jgi:ribonucleoside-diphosphate reductase alpha chain
MKRDLSIPSPAALPPQPISLDLLREKYLNPGETTAQDLMRRVARALASVEAEPVRAL